MTMKPRVQPIIMSGGSGTRLWPMSRAATPKQFLPLTGAHSLFQETALRFQSDANVDFNPPLVIAGAGHGALVENQLRAIGIEAAGVLLEPFARNTAAVAAIAAVWTAEHAKGALALLSPADHFIKDAAALRDAIAAGCGAANRGAIVTIGVKPTEPHTGFGYIECGAPVAEHVFEIGAFREKPQRDVAERYVAGGRHFWNAGMFLFAPDTMDGELAMHAPAIRKAAAAALARAPKSRVATLDATTFADCPSESIDYAVMEKTTRAAVVGPLDAGWSDIGSWTALAASDADPRIASHDCDNVLIRTDGPFVGAVGLKDMIVVATGDAVLVLPKDRAQDVKRIVDDLKARGRSDLL
jgi:mannose-1-phosphate guanylyltransferase/mannose-6-phosphate isomerase